MMQCVLCACVRYQMPTRIATVIIYLSDVEDGGETVFPWLGAGSNLMWDLSYERLERLSNGFFLGPHGVDRPLSRRLLAVNATTPRSPSSSSSPSPASGAATGVQQQAANEPDATGDVGMESVAQMARREAAAALEVHDTNSDGQLSMAEWGRWLDAVAASEGQQSPEVATPLSNRELVVQELLAMWCGWRRDLTET
jgi:hypothetical protein